MSSSPLETSTGVTVVVPVYGDLPSLLDCIASLVDHVDTSRHRVLLVNDCGPDADAIERAVLEA
ncbi:glycosyltransferase family 2 protein, partial [Escherichia coli]|uniref:glycosyltransferase family 2 protein n=2 Tax=Bacteria TaxID=2 RepID=UPI001365A5DA